MIAAIETLTTDQAPLALVVFLGLQEWPGHEPMPLYNVVAGEGLTVGSTVTLASLRAKGYVPVNAQTGESL